MKVILVFVQSLDGKITKWGYPIVRSWSSKEDQDYFSSLMKKSELTVVGSNTYNFDPFKPSPGHLLVVMTGHPELYRTIQGSIEFSNLSPTELVKEYSARYDQMLMVGGPHLATSFFTENLIDEIWLTIEPKIFGSGGNFVTDQNLDIRLQLKSLEKINNSGTLILKYSVLKL
ncbi:MAG TPA: dihydrofolate reductase family protein [Bacteroidales bacterium]|nr:dihydrofolate reductase family protein [Bacteroidales bacterium]